MNGKKVTVANLGECHNSRNMKLPVARSLLVICIVACSTFAPRSFAAESTLAKNGLVLESFTDRNVVRDPVLLKSTVRSHVTGTVNFQVESLESERFGTEGYEAGLSESLAALYAGKLDLVITNFIAGIALVLVQSLLIIGLLLQRARRRRAETRLRESEKRFRVMADTTPALVWMSDKDGKVTYLNNRRVEFTGRDPAAGFDDAWRTFIHPDDLQEVQTANARGHESQKAFSKEYRLRRRDGVYRWILDLAAPRINDDGSFAGFIGSAIDISDQKMANEALETISGRLIEAQEKERSRIARELHDDICQRLALLSLELGQDSSQSGSPGASRVEEIRDRCIEIAGDVQALSHELHSSKLDYLGVEAAIRSFCHEFSQQHHVDVEFTSENIPNPLPRDVSLSLFRVTQEALHNAAKYSGVNRFRVDLRSFGDDIQLEIKDSGAGFQPDEAKQNGGLGLVSMQERIHLVKGTFTVESRINRGTTILARVPFHAET